MITAKEYKEACQEAWQEWHGNLEIMPELPNPSFERGFKAAIKYIESRKYETAFSSFAKGGCGGSGGDAFL